MGADRGWGLGCNREEAQTPPLPSESSGSGGIPPKPLTPEPPLARTSSGGPLNVQRMQFGSHTYLRSDSGSAPHWLCDPGSTRPLCASVGILMPPSRPSGSMLVHPWVPSAPEAWEGHAPLNLWDRGPLAGRHSAVDRGPGRQL